MTEENSEGAFDKVKKGFKKVAEGSANVVEGTAHGVKKVVEETKEGVEETAEGVKGTGREATDNCSCEDHENRDYNQPGGKEPMNPEDIASHEPTAVSRNQDTEITEEGQSGTDSAEAKEKFRKKGMTET
jgi:hypothetical protein